MRAVDDQAFFVHALDELLSDIGNAVVLRILAATGQGVVIVVGEIIYNRTLKNETFSM